MLEAIAELFPSAPIFTLFHDVAGLPPSMRGRQVVASFLNRVPGAKARHRHFLPLMPGAIRALDVGPVDLVISSSHCVAKGIRVPAGARHVSYVHAPLRYMWDRFDDYFGEGRAPLPVRLAALAARPALRAWDVLTADGVDRFVANSTHVARQVAQRYHRFARVIHPPVELDALAPGGRREGYFLWLGALAPYKRVDLAIEAFRRTGQTLWIAGSGQSASWLKHLPPNIKALGQVSDAEVPALYRGARALIFPGVEDFGIAPVEAQACGVPVIAFGRGGALETVSERTGVFFSAQTVEALVGALERFERFEATFDPEVAVANAQRFSKASFQAQLLEELTAACA